MAKAKQDKYIDLDQFPHDNNGKISWKDSVGIVVEFFYNGERHELEVLTIPNKNRYLSIKIDDVVIDKTHTSNITKLTFSKLFYKPDYFYNVGDVVNGLVILEQTKTKMKSSKGNGFAKVKAYNVKCLCDGYEFISDEWNLKDGHGCPVCAGKKTVAGYNDVATLHPDLARLFDNYNDAIGLSPWSPKKVLVVCPYCGFKKYMRISELVRCGYVTCDKCSDGFSYPNKFSHELFSQLSQQYLYYEYEYSPDWAGNYVFDNYIECLDGAKLVVEMDGIFHYENIYDETGVTTANNDAKKDELCKKHNIDIVRINCHYKDISKRALFIKENIINKLFDYFDLSKIDWDKCDSAGVSRTMYEVINFYNANENFSLDYIASYFKIGNGLMHRFLREGEKLGLCTYIRNDPKRKKNSRPIAMYDAFGSFIGIFKSAKYIVEEFPEKDFYRSSVTAYCKNGKQYKGYIFKYVTYEEYYEYLNNDNSQIIV